MVIDSPGLTIGIRERYRDVVSEKWPVIVTPQADELLSSWLHRLAFANGIAPRPFARVLGLRAVPFHVGSYPHDVKKFRAS